jgi:hypothetical protein
MTRSSNRIRLELERLEERTVPTIFINPAFKPQVVLKGGGALSDTPIYLIFVGDDWQGGSQQLRSNIDQAARTVFHNASPYLAGLEEYGTDGNAWIAGDIQRSMDFSDPNQIDSEVQTLLQQLISDPFSGVPAPGNGVTPAYAFITPPSVSIPDAAGYHDWQQGLSYIVAGTNPGDAGTSNPLDAAMVDLSHEVAETITDPHANHDLTGADLIPATNAPDAGDGGNEIADYEAGVYYGRDDGVLVQAYYSNNLGKYILPSDTLQSLTLTPHWNGDTFENYSMTVSGDQFGPLWGVYNDTITLDQDAEGGVIVNLNGDVFSFQPGDIADVTVNAGQGNDTVNVEDTAPGEPVYLYLGSGTDTVNISPSGQWWGKMQSTVGVNGNGSTTLNIYDQADGWDPTYTLGTAFGGGFVNNSVANPIFYGGVKTLNAYGGQGGGNWSVQGGMSGTAINLYGNSGADTFNVGQSSAALTLPGPLSVDGGAGSNTLTFDDRASSFSFMNWYNFAAGSITRDGANVIGGGLFNDNIVSLSYGNVQSLTVWGARSVSSYGVAQIASGTPVTLHTGASGSSVNVGDGNNTFGGIGDDLTVYGGNASDTIVLNDQGTADTPSTRHSPAWTVDAGMVMRADTIQRRFGFSWSLTTVSHTVFYSGVGSVTVNGSTTDKNTFTVRSTAGNTPVTLTAGNAGDQFNLGDANNNLDFFAGTLTLNGGTGSDSIMVNDQADVDSTDPPRLVYDLQNQSQLPNGQVLLRTDTNPNAVPPADVEFGNIENVTLNASPYGNEIDIDSTRATTAVTINAGSAADSIVLGSGNDRIGAVVGPLTVHGAGGNDALKLYDDATTAARAYTITGSKIGWAPLGTTPVPTHITYDGLASVEIDGGSGGNLFIVSGSRAATTLKSGAGADTIQIAGSASPFAGPLAVDGQAGVNTLDYSKFTGTAIVDLPLGAATVIARGIKNIRNVTGGNGNDMFVGDGTGNVLTGGTGRSILIAGAGAGTLKGNAGQDLLVGGTTNYDTNLTALKAILAEWTSTSDYAIRVQHLLQGGGANGTTRLSATTFTNNGGVNTMTGAGDLDLFYGVKARDNHDWNGSLGEVFVENPAQVSFRIDAHLLSLPLLTLDDTTPVYTKTPASFSVAPGVHTLWDYYGSGSTITFTVRADGTVTYDSSFAGILSGQGTNTLTVRGKTIKIDAHTVSMSFMTMDIGTARPTASTFPFTVLPGPQSMHDYYWSGSEIDFNVAMNGVISFDSSYAGTLSLATPSTLVVSGQSVTIDPRGLSLPTMVVNTTQVRPTSALFTLSLLPGDQWLTDNYGWSAPLHFTVSSNGTISYASSLSSFFSVQGSTLKVTGETLQIDATALSQQAAMFSVNSMGGLVTAKVQSLHVLPGTFQATIGTEQLVFTLSAPDSLDYATNLDAKLSGRSTNRLVVRS